MNLLGKCPVKRFINQLPIPTHMEKQTQVCSSCKKSIKNSKGATVFNCPNCGKVEIARCEHCREIAAKYTCPECKFEGPN
jgi:Zn-ribbon RNA-binding protein